MVVPMFAPRITPTACWSDMRPVFTKLTRMTVVALELWIIAVTTAPATRPINRLLVSLLSMLFILLPATRMSPSDISFMPNRNRARPPIISKMIVLRFIATDSKRTVLIPQPETEISATATASPILSGRRTKVVDEPSESVRTNSR